MEDTNQHETQDTAQIPGYGYENRKALLNRFSRALGHLEKVKEMVEEGEEGEDCSRVLVQLAAVRSALNSMGKVILKDHLRKCLEDAVTEEDYEVTDGICKVIDRFIKEVAMYTLENCARLWDEAGQHGSVPERIERAKRWFPYYSYLAQSIKPVPFVLPKEPSPFVAFMNREGMLKNTDTLLDIGAGMGNFALEVSRYCRSVTALEPNRDCLGVLQRRAEICGVENVLPVEGFWEEYSPEEPFDVTFSSMCPAICNVEELKKWKP